MSNAKVVYGAYGYVVGTSETIAQYLSHASSSDEEAKLTVTLLFSREALLYDISNIAYVEADVMEAENPHQSHQVFDITEDGNIDRITRILDLVHTSCVEGLYPFTKDSCEDGMELNDNFSETDTYVITLKVPQDFSSTTAKYFEQLIHEYMVDMALAEWLMITKPTSAQNWAAKAQNIIEEIKSKLNTRSGRILRPLRPF